LRTLISWQKAAEDYGNEIATISKVMTDAATRMTTTMHTAVGAAHRGVVELLDEFVASVLRKGLNGLALPLVAVLVGADRA
jgi:hypothetical protein